MTTGYRYAMQQWVTDGVRVNYDISFDGGYLHQADVLAIREPYSGGEVTGPEETLAVTFVVDNPDDGETATVRVGATPATPQPVGYRVTIYRSTEKGVPLVDFENGAVLTGANLDKLTKQAIFAVAEVTDQVNDIDAATIDALEGFEDRLTDVEAEAAAATASAATANTNATAAQATASSAVATANTALSTANATAALLDDAIDAAEAATAAANAATAALDGIEAEVQAAVDDANEAVTTANAASANANALSGQIATANTNATAALNTANAIDAKAQDALDTADAAAATANTASTNASSALTTANAAMPKAGGTFTGDTVHTQITSGDITTRRVATPTTGAMFFGTSGFRYIFWDGTTYSLGDAAGGPLPIWHTGNLSDPVKLSGDQTISGNKIISGNRLRWTRAGQTNSFDVAIGITGASDPDVALWNAANGAIRLYTNNTERGRVRADGILEWDKTVKSVTGTAFSPASSVTAGIGFLATGSYGGAYGMQDGSTYGAMWMQSGALSLGTGTSTYTRHFYTDATGTFSAGGFQPISSVKVKTALRPVKHALRTLDKLEFVTGKYRKDFAKGGRRYFALAEQTAEHAPELVTQNAFEYKGEKIPALDYNGLAVLTSAAVQELLRIVQQQQEQINELREMLE